jgi:integrase
MAILAMGCGLRQGECFGLAVSDVDFLGRRVNVSRQVKILGGRRYLALPKGGKKRRVPLPEWVGFGLSEQLRLRGTHDFEDMPIEAGADNPGGGVPVLLSSGCW